MKQYLVNVCHVIDSKIQENYFMFSSSLEHFSQAVSSSFDVYNLPHDEHFIVCFSYILLIYTKSLKGSVNGHVN